MKKKRFIFPICLMLSLSGCVMYNGLPPEEAEHQHEYATEYSYDSEEHWFAATCEHTDQRKGVEKHSFGDYVVTQEPTLSKEGLKVRTCSICGYKDEVVLNKLSEGGQEGGNTTDQWTISGINVDRENIEITVGDNPISIVPTIVGEGKFPTSLAIYCADATITKTVEGEPVTENLKVAEISSNVVESGTAFTVKAIAAGNTKITITSVGKTDVSKEIDVVVNPKAEQHSLTLSETNITMNKGSIRVLGATSTDDITWSSSNEEVVTLENKTNTGVWLKSLKASGETPVVISAIICAGTPYEVVKNCFVTVVSTDQTVFDYYFINNQLLTDLHLYMWGECGTNADWPGAPIGERLCKDTYLNDVYKITIDIDDKPYEKIIISGKDSNDEFLQTDDIVLSSFKTQNAFTIPNLPSAGSDGVRKASIKMCTFNPSTDAIQGGSIRFSMNEANLIVGDTLDVICYASESPVDYVITSGSDVVELTYSSSIGFTVKALAVGTAEVKASITADGVTYSATLNVTVKEDEEVTYYFANNYLWKSLKVYLWGNKGSNGEFPGALFKKAPVKNNDGVNTYELTFSKHFDGYTHLIVSGTDAEHGWAKTADIDLTTIPADKNMIYITETSWQECDNVGGEQIYICSFGFGLFESLTPRISIADETKEIAVNVTVDIPVSTNSDFEIINSDNTVVEATKGDDKITVKGLTPGTAVITAKVDDEVSDSITITVIEDYLVHYYFVNNYKWTDLKVFMWNESLGKSNAEFPGVSLGERAFVNLDGNDVYSISFNRYADNYEAFIISGNDSSREGQCKTVDIPISSFGDNNGVELDGWKENENTALVKYGFYVYQLYLNVAINVEFGEGTQIPLNVNTNGQNVTYELTSGSDKIELQNQSNTGVTLVGKATGTATFTVSVQDGSQSVTKTVNVNVLPDEEFTYYFINEYEWTDVKAYLFVNEQVHSSWPGENMTLLGKDERGKEVYSISFKKYSDGFKGMVINGYDTVKENNAKTEDIIFDQLVDNHNCIYVAGWANEPEFVAGYGTKVMGDYILLSNYSLEVDKDATVNLTFVSSDEVILDNSDDTVLDVTLHDGYVELTALKKGTSVVTFTIGTGENAVSKACTVNVFEDELVTYYFSNNYCWSNLNVHLWKSETEYKDIPLTSTMLKNKEGQDVYAFSFYKDSEAFTGMIIQGNDSSKVEPCKTVDIDLTSLGEGQNNIYLNDWDSIYVAKIGTASYDPDFVVISDGSQKTICPNETFQIEVKSNYEVSYVVDTTAVVQITRNGNMFEVKGLTAGTATITFYNGTEDNKINPQTYTVDVTAATVYTINGVPSEYLDYNAKLYVWAWDGNNNGAWYECEYNNGTITFLSGKNDLVGAIVVRFNPDLSGAPSFSSEYYWNQSGDLTITNYVASF